MPLPLLGLGLAAGASALGGLFGSGSKPKLTPYVPVDLTGSQAATIQGNLETTPAAQELASKTNVFNQQQILAMLKAAVPGYQQIQETTGKQIGSLLKGELPADVSAYVKSQAASKAVAGGFAGGGMASNLTMRDLGLTSLQAINQGLDAANRWIQTTRATAVPELFDVSRMFMTPAQRASLDVSQRVTQWQAQNNMAIADAAPDPTMAAIGGTLSSLGGLAGGMFAQNWMNKSATSNLMDSLYGVQKAGEASSYQSSMRQKYNIPLGG